VLSQSDQLPNLYPYRAVSKIGEGGNGRVYLVEEPGRADRIALKVLHPECIRRGALLNEFLRAAKEVGALGHSNIVKVLNIGYLNTGEPFVAMEYLAGRDLGDLLAQVGSLDYRKVIDIVGQACAGLAAAHRKGHLHLDIKPNNIFVLDSPQKYNVKILDFGSAKLLSQHTDCLPEGSRDSMVNGTPEYWSPEQACGQHLDQRSDIYSIGVVMYEALSGRPPFWSHSVSDMIAQHVHCEPALLAQQPHTPAIPDALIKLVLRCLKKDPDKRFQNMEELSRELSAIPVDSSDKKKLTIRVCPTCNARYPDDKSYCSNDGTRLSDLDSVTDQGAVSTSCDIGGVLGSYRLLKLLGEGGMGRVFLAEHIRLGRKVALKTLRTEYASNPEAVARFFREARAVNRINHENIVEITDFVEADGQHNYYIMELLEGRNLGDLMRAEGKLPISRALGIGVQISKALSAAHNAGVIHRDLKSENIFLIERGGQIDFVKLLDFGVAKLTELGSGQAIHKTASGIIIGTPEYMSPEQASGVDVDHRADIYSLGVILLEMITGVNPFSANAKSFGEVLVRHLTLKVPRLTEIANKSIHLPKQFEDLIFGCLEKEPQKRPQRMTDVEEQLRQIADRESLQLESYVSHSRPKRKAPAKVIGIACAVIVASAAVVKLRPNSNASILRPMTRGSIQTRSSGTGPKVLQQTTDLSKTGIDTTSAVKSPQLSDRPVPEGLAVDLVNNDEKLDQEPVASRTESRVNDSVATGEPARQKVKSAPTKRKARTPGKSTTPSKRSASKGDKRATVDPFAD
jgi:eukaryotic-like serine/threonine-protein kinase